MCFLANGIFPLILIGAVRLSCLLFSLCCVNVFRVVFAVGIFSPRLYGLKAVAISLGVYLPFLCL